MARSAAYAPLSDTMAALAAGAAAAILVAVAAAIALGTRITRLVRRAAQERERSP